MNYHILFNPTAATNHGKDFLDKLSSLFPRDELHFVDMLAIPDYAAFFSSLDPADGVIVCGGDGTLNHFINDTAGLDIPNPLYHYPSGSGNDFCRDVEKKQKDGPFPIDRYLGDLPVVRVQGKEFRFLNGIGMGLDGYCCEEVERKKKLGKHANYALAAAKGLLGAYRTGDAVVTTDGVRHAYRNVWMVVTMKGRFCGGGFMLTPQQDRMNPDGTLTVIVLHDAKPLRILSLFASAMKGKHLKYTKIVDFYTVHEVTVEYDKPSAVQIDGEVLSNVTNYRVNTDTN